LFLITIVRLILFICGLMCNIVERVLFVSYPCSSGQNQTVLKSLSSTDVRQQLLCELLVLDY